MYMYVMSGSKRKNCNLANIERILKIQSSLESLNCVLKGLKKFSDAPMIEEQ